MTVSISQGRDYNVKYNSNNKKAIKRAERIRKVQLYRNIGYSALVLIVIAVILMVIIRLCNDKTVANASLPDNYSYVSVEVTEGESLWSIAEDNIDSYVGDSVGDYVKLIKDVNNINNDNIESGAYIIVPVYDFNY